MPQVVTGAKKVWHSLLKDGRVWWMLLGILLFVCVKGLIGLGSGAGAATAGGGKHMPSGSGVPVEIGTVTESGIADTAVVAGTLRADKGITLRPEVAGVVRGLPFKEGEPVKAGTLLVQLDDAITKADVAQAKAQLKLAKNNFERLKALHEEDAELVSKRDYDTAESAMEVAAATVQTAQAQFDKTHIAAPFTGTVGLQQVSLGEYVTVGQDLVTLQSLDPLKVEFSLPESDNGSVQPGMEIAVTLDALGGKTVSGTITAVDPEISSGGRNVNITAKVGNADGVLRPGMFARVATSFGSADNALQVSEEAIVPEGDDKYVYKVVDGKAVKTKVRIGIRSNGRVQVLEGLAKDETVVTAGLLKLSDGAKVTPMNLSVQASAKPQQGAPHADAVMPAAGPGAVSGSMMPTLPTPRDNSSTQAD